MTPIRIATYARVSTDDQNEANQQPALDHYVQTLRTAPNAPPVLVVPFVDHGVSGAKTSRPAFDRMIADAHAGAFDRIVFWKLDRLGRNREQLMRIGRELGDAGVRLVSLHEALDTTTATGNLFYGFMAVLAQYERELISDRTKLGLRRAAAAGPLRRRGPGKKEGPVSRMTEYRRARAARKAARQAP